MEFEDDDLPARKLDRLSQGFALRDLISGAEFQISPNDDEDETNGLDTGEYVSPEKAFDSEQLYKYYNSDALDVDANDNSGEPVMFSELRMKMDNVIPNGKIMKRVKVNGLGETVPDNSIVYIHYIAYSNLEPIPFDNSYLRCKRPERFTLGKGALVIGLECSIKTMRKGEIAQFLVEHDYAYGEKGCPPRIPPGATVCFEVELVNFTEGTALETNEDEQLNGTADDRYKFDNVYKVAQRNHLLGNDLFNQRNEKAAAVKYKKALDLLLDVRMENDEQEEKRNKFLMKLYTNLSICYKRLKQPEKTCIMCREAFYTDPNRAKSNAKINYNWGVALVMLGDYSRASEKLKLAYRLDPNCREIREEIAKLEEKKKMYSQQEKIMFQKAFGMMSVQAKPQDEDNKEIDAREELIQLVEEKIAKAKKVGFVKFTLPNEVLKNILELCKDMAAEAGLFVENFENNITICKKDPIK